MSTEEMADRYIELLKGLSPSRLDELRSHLSAQVQFRDPFNDVKGCDAFMRVFEKIFADVEDLRFDVVDRAFSGDTCYLRWHLSCRAKGRKSRFDFDGVSEVRFDSEGLIVAHIDHWDAGSQFYAKLPLIGFLIEGVRRRLSANR